MPPLGPPPPPTGYAGYGAVQPKTSGMAIAALVVGIVAVAGIFCYGILGIILGAVAIFLGLTARSQIKRAGGALGGSGLATAGWIIGICAAVLGVLVLIFYVGIFALVITNAIHTTPSP